MLLQIFIFLVVLALVLIIGGFYIEAPVTQIAGTAILFVTGLLLLVGSVEYPSGSNQQVSYTYVSGNLSSSTINETTTFSSWDEEVVQGVQVKHTLAFLLLVTSILILVSVLAQLKEGDGLDDE